MLAPYYIRSMIDFFAQCASVLYIAQKSHNKEKYFLENVYKCFTMFYNVLLSSICFIYSSFDSVKVYILLILFKPFKDKFYRCFALSVILLCNEFVYLKYMYVASKSFYILLIVRNREKLTCFIFEFHWLLKQAHFKSLRLAKN